jgi:signal peptidase I
MSDEFEDKRPESGEEEGAPGDPPFDWPSSADWGRPPEREEPSSDPYARDPYPPEPYSSRAPYPDENYSEQSYPARGVLESSGSARRSRDPLARLFPGLPHGMRVALDWILTIAGAILIVLALKQWVVNPYRIPSSSMEPTLNCAKPGLGCLGESSDRVLACRICLDFRAPSRGDIVVFNTPREAALKCGEGGTFVKRVIGLPGERVRETDNGMIQIRGPDSKTWVTLKEPYLSSQTRLADSAHFGQQWPQNGKPIPPGDYFMMGDNRSQSCDSRSWGPVPRSKLIGTVFFVYWPPDRIGFR